MDDGQQDKCIHPSGVSMPIWVIGVYWGWLHWLEKDDGVSGQSNGDELYFLWVSKN